jgi:hypothetical protein
MARVGAMIRRKPNISSHLLPIHADAARCLLITGFQVRVLSDAATSGFPGSRF